MRYYTHLAFGFLSGLIIMPFIAADKIIFIALVLLGSILPDIDQPNSKISNNIPILPRLISIFSKHRGVFHSLLFAVLIPGLLWIFIGYSYGIAVFTGYLSHLLIDAFTKQGINFLHPFANMHLSGFIETGTFSELFVFIGILGLIIIKLI
jgi:inner membrane protein